MSTTTSKKALTETLRASYLEQIIGLFTDTEEVLRTASNEIAIPCVDADSEDRWIVITVKVPTGSKESGPYDGYAAAEEYTMKCTEKAEKAKEAAAKKAAKIAKDKADREAKAVAKAAAAAAKLQ